MLMPEDRVLFIMTRIKKTSVWKTSFVSKYVAVLGMPANSSAHANDAKVLNT